MTLKGYIDFLNAKQAYEQAKDNYGFGPDSSNLTTEDVCKFLEENNFKELPSKERRYWSRGKHAFGIGNKPSKNSIDRDSFVYAKLPSAKNVKEFIEKYEEHLNEMGHIKKLSLLLSTLTAGVYGRIKADKREEGIKRCFDLTYSPSFGDRALEKLVEICEGSEK